MWIMLDVADNGGEMRVRVTESRIDAAIAILFKDELRKIVLSNRKPVVVDMRQVDFMDSSGLGAVIAVRKAMPDGLPLILDGLTPNVERVFRLTRMDAVFEIRPGITEERQVK